MGSSYNVRSTYVLNNLKWKTLETRRFHTKATLMYKILKHLSAPQLSNSFVKLNDTNINYNLTNIETDLALPRPCTNFLKRSFKYSGACNADVDNTLFDLQNSSYPTQPHSIITK